MKNLRNKNKRRSVSPHPKANYLHSKLNEAVAFHKAGDLIAAEKTYKEILKSQPNNFDALHLLGVVALQSGAYMLALDYLNKAIPLNPTFVEALFNRGVVYKNLQQFDLALSEYTKVLELNQSHKNAHFDTGYLLQQLGEYDDAIKSYGSAIEVDPAFHEAKIYRANLNRQLKRFEIAAEECDQVIEVDPLNSLAHSIMALIFYDKNEMQDALLWSDKAIQLNSKSGLLHNHRGVILRGLWRLNDAAESFQLAIKLTPNLAEAHSNYGLVLQDLGRLDLAIQAFDEAIKLDALNPNAHFNRSVANLTVGELNLGFTEYEWRNRAFKLIDSNLEFIPQWDGVEHLFDKVLLIRCEQGMGDTIQFSRYATIISSLARSVVFEVQEPLVEILSSLDGNINVVPKGISVEGVDLQCPLLSLPHFLGTTIETIPSRNFYLQAPRDKILVWKNKLDSNFKLHVGVVWSGGFRQDQPELWAVNARRNIPLEMMVKLIHPEICFHSLQKGEPAESELEDYLKNNPGINLINHASELIDFSDTAALINNLDLVISVDTSTAHLAAALGKPTWILNRFDTCWRWFLHRTDSPWYPSVRIYRQNHSGDWSDVISRIQSDLSSLKG